MKNEVKNVGRRKMRTRRSTIEDGKEIFRGSQYATDVTATDMQPDAGEILQNFNTNARMTVATFVCCIT